MDQQLPLANIITFGVRDFAGEREFYRRLGWPHAFDSDSFTVFELRGALLAIFGFDELGADARATPEPGTGPWVTERVTLVAEQHPPDGRVGRYPPAGGRRVPPCPAAMA